MKWDIWPIYLQYLEGWMYDLWSSTDYAYTCLECHAVGRRGETGREKIPFCYISVEVKTPPWWLRQRASSQLDCLETLCDRVFPFVGDTLTVDVLFVGCILREGKKSNSRESETASPLWSTKNTKGLSSQSQRLTHAIGHVPRAGKYARAKLAIQLNTSEMISYFHGIAGLRG